MLLGDDVLKVPSSQATEALEAASVLLDCYKEDANNKRFNAFTKWLVVSLYNCFMFETAYFWHRW